MPPGGPRPRGKLIVVEGIDGSGKSTQIKLLHKWLEARGHQVVFTEWNSSDLVRQATKRGKKKNLLTPTTFSLLHATDFADRLTYRIIPYLKSGMTVLADRYVYTAFARDIARGVDARWVRDLYSFAVKPDAAFYFRVPIDVAVGRTPEYGFRVIDGTRSIDSQQQQVRSMVARLYRGQETGEA